MIIMSTKYGQNFLVDEKVALKEVEYAQVFPTDVVLEIGPGKGVLTKLLAERARKVIAIEIDEKLVDNLINWVPDNVELIHDDVLNVDFNSLPYFNKVVSNLPFEISSPLTFKLLDYDFDFAILIYQKEFANRMVADVGSEDYSRLTVGVYYKSVCDVLDIVSKNCFDPVPKVDSCIVKIVPRKEPPFIIENEGLFFDLTRELFNQRRKMIKNTIQNVYNINVDVPYGDRRVEELSPEEIGRLSNFIFNLKGNI